MTTKTKTIHLIAYFDKYNKRADVFISDSDFQNTEGYTSLTSKEISFEIPDYHIINEVVIAGLRDVQKEMRATSAAAITEVDEQVCCLLSLEDQSEA